MGEHCDGLECQACYDEQFVVYYDDEIDGSPDTEDESENDGWTS